MGNLAVLLAQLGHDVRGSDSGVYPPMDGILARARIPVATPYGPQNLEPHPDLVIVGNVCRPDHIEARAAIEAGLALCSLPGALSSLVLRGRRALVVAGTHGKTTTSAMVVHILRSAGLDPGFLVGGRILGAESGAAAGSGELFVIEGDEYDSAFFEKRAKFLGYQAHGLILTSVEHDHVDIYPTWGSYRRAFERLVTGMPASGRVVACADHEAVMEVAGLAPCRVSTYGLGPSVEAHYRAVDLVFTEAGTSFVVAGPSGDLGRFELPATGAHNVTNALAALVLCIEHARVPLSCVRRALASFPGVARRQHLVGTPAGVRVLDDFGHHPTAVAVTLQGLRAGLPALARIVAIFRPASATACRNLHQASWPAALAHADRVILAPLARTNLAPEERLDLAALGKDIEALGRTAVLAPSLDDLPALVRLAARPGDAVVLFSNSDTAGVLARIVEALAQP